MKAAIYSRYSTEQQSEASIEDQFRVCERIAERDGFTVVARFSDAAVSGGTSVRSGYQSMLRAMRRREFDAIIAEDSSRLWRNLAEQAPRLAELADLGVQVVTHDLDTRQESAGILGAVLGASSEAYRKEIGRRTRRGQEGVARAGKSAGGRAYGYVPAALSGTGQLEVNAEQATVIRQVFTWYAEGVAARTIAARLNAQGVPSPGSSWNRERRRKAGWLASAIHGDPKRGTGILSNTLYSGAVVWNRTRWVRSAADSSKRRCVLNSPKDWITRQDERLRIVPQELWDRVRARQARMSHQQSALTVRGSARRGGGGKPGKYLFTGLLVCGVCGAAFTLRNRDYYCCASHWHGAACSNSVNVSRHLVQDVMLDGIREDLSDPVVIAEVERRLRDVVRQYQRRPKVDQGKRIAALTVEIGNLTDAIASGMLKSSPALALRLQAAEAELARLEAARRAEPPTLMVPNVKARYLAKIGRLEDVLLKEPERGREELREVLDDERIRLKPDESGKFLWAEYSLGLQALLPHADTVVAGAGFEPATFGL
jgi:site-specific DNA recombinase